MSDHNAQAPQEEAVDHPKVKPSRSGWRALRIGCAGFLLLTCGLSAGLAAMLQSGPANLDLPFGNRLKIGSDDFVLSNSSFQNGSTYYLDLNGGGVRNILQVEYLEDKHSLQLTLHHSTKGERNEQRLLEMPLP